MRLKQRLHDPLEKLIARAPVTIGQAKDDVHDALHPSYLLHR